MKVSYWKYDPEFIAELAGFLHGKKVLEVFAGNGLLSHYLHEMGVDIKPTTLFATHDGHQSWCNPAVEELSATDAILRFGENSDVLLMSWPEVSQDALRAALDFFSTENASLKKLIFIGERTRLESGILGGCATDEFFACFPEGIVHQRLRYKGNLIEVAEVLSCPSKESISHFRKVVERKGSSRFGMDFLRPR